MRATIFAALISTASAAHADVAEWIWTVGDTGNCDGAIEPGESALLTLEVAFDPAASGVAEAGPYTIGGDSLWAAGTVETFENLLDQQDMFGDGSLDQATNTITEIHHFQLPPFINDTFNSYNPAQVYRISWKPDRYAVETVSIWSDAPDTWIYIGDFGERLLYEGAGGLGSFTVVPAPATLAVFLAVFGLGAHRRR